MLKKKPKKNKLDFEKHFNNSYKANKINASKQLKSQDHLWICGKHPVFCALKSKKRKIFEILVTKNSILELEKFLEKNSLQNFKNLIKLVEGFKIEELCGQNQLHQGIAIRCSRLVIKTQNELLEELYKIEDKNQLPKLLLLDQISDPHNIGAIIRSAISFGITKIIFCEHNSPKENATIAKSAAGTIELADLVIVTNFNNLIEKLKKIGYWCIGLAGEGESNLSKLKEYKNIALIVGSEGDGIRNLVKKNCDFLARIEINNEVESLNASVATAIALYELTK